MQPCTRRVTYLGTPYGNKCALHVVHQAINIENENTPPPPPHTHTLTYTNDGKIPHTDFCYCKDSSGLQPTTPHPQLDRPESRETLPPPRYSRSAPPDTVITKHDRHVDPLDRNRQHQLSKRNYVWTDSYYQLLVCGDAFSLPCTSFLGLGIALILMMMMVDLRLLWRRSLSRD